MQKFINYGGCIAIYGDYSRHTYKTLHDFERYCTELDVCEERDGLVPDVTLFCCDEDRDLCVGAVNIRLILNSRLLWSGGDIGNGICLSERGKGYGKEMLSLVLKECKNAESRVR